MAPHGRTWCGKCTQVHLRTVGSGVGRATEMKSTMGTSSCNRAPSSAGFDCVRSFSTRRLRAGGKLGVTSRHLEAKCNGMSKFEETRSKIWGNLGILEFWQVYALSSNASCPAGRLHDRLSRNGHFGRFT